MDATHEVWAVGDRYEPYVGRWSRRVAPRFLEWLSVGEQRDWVDVGCGTGALMHAILETQNPTSVTGVDSSAGFLQYAKTRFTGVAARFEIGDAEALPLEDGSADALVSGLVLNFVPRPAQALMEMARVARPGGVVGLYVWDYAGGMQMMRHFWDAAVALDPAAENLDEGRRFRVCEPRSLEALFAMAQLDDIEVRSIEIETVFRDFDDYWTPFLGAQGPAPGYLVSLSEQRREALRERVRAGLPVAEDGAIRLVARAWAARGRRR